MAKRALANEGSVLETIPVVEERFNSSDYFDAAQEVIDSINFLVGGGSQKAFSLDAMPHDALTVYYADFILQRLVNDGCREFIATQLPLHPLTARDIDNALHALGAEGHHRLLSLLVEEASQGNVNFQRYDRAFKELQQHENLRSLNDHLLRSSREFKRMSEADANAEISRLLAIRVAATTTN